MITGRLNPHIDPVLSIWEWQIPVYLFLGGLAAGLMVLGAISVLQDGRRIAEQRGAGSAERRERSVRDTRREEERDAPVSQRLMAIVPVVLAVGMFTLFLDLAHKEHVWRFYTTFQVTAPMSWGAWTILLVLPANLLLVAGLVPELWPSTFERIRAWRPSIASRLGCLHGRRVTLAYVNVAGGAALGIYTGILLSAYVARPFWNTSILGPLFLISGLSSAAALIQWVSREPSERHRFGSVDLGLIAVELLLIGLLIVNMSTGPLSQRLAADLVLGGSMTPYFWVFVIGAGILLPASLEIIELRGGLVPRFLAPALVLLGGLVFRFFIVQAGQMTTWIAYQM